MKILPAVLLLALTFSACAQTPDGVKSASWSRQAELMDGAVPR
ncbi:hypothetical protein LCGC14_0291650 [marine sediment metagenome]|uniref:Uncharacterized protein n=1 Tax=marine sediment metagenome TaxID=412755 RepID=A0A0F9TY10_9ZZZZ|nr:hypothetical protein [Aurantimonas sp. A3-2-R12]